MDVRIVACTNRNIEEEFKKNCFRKDLFYLLNVFPITILPLREREQDIPLLVKYFAEKFGWAMEKAEKRLWRISLAPTKITPGPGMFES